MCVCVCVSVRVCVRVCACACACACACVCVLRVRTRGDSCKQRGGPARDGTRRAVQCDTEVLRSNGGEGWACAKARSEWSRWMRRQIAKEQSMREHTQSTHTHTQSTHAQTHTHTRTHRATTYTRYLPHHLFTAAAAPFSSPLPPERAQESRAAFLPSLAFDSSGNDTAAPASA